MRSYRLKPPTFEARKFNGKPDILTNGLFEWLGPTAKVVRCDAKSITVSVNQRTLIVDEWIVRNQATGHICYVSPEDFERDFEVDE